MATRPIYNYKTDFGVPQWQNAGEYPDPNTTTDTQWRWEFMRRRPDYRQAWFDHYDDCQAKHDERDVQGLFRAPGAARQNYYAVGSTLRIHTERFGVQHIAAPWLQEPPFALFTPRFGWSIGGAVSKPYMDDLEARGVFLIAFDLSLPIKDQLHAANTYLQALQDEVVGKIKAPRHHRPKWPIYLRAIDARDQGATFENLFLALRLAILAAPDFDVDERLNRNLAANGSQLCKQAKELMFKVTA